MDKKISRWINVEIVQQPKKSKEFLNNLKSFLNNCKSIDKFAYILHDKDLKTPHYHCLVKFKTPAKTETILNFFHGSIKYENLQHVCKWSAAVEYLTHKNDSSKHQYDVNEIVSNFNVNEFNASNSNKKDLFTELLVRVSKGETLSKLIENKENKKVINKNLNAFKFERSEYFKRKKRKYRLTNIYISGPGRTGKTTLAKQLAIAIVNHFHLKKYDSDGYFMVGTKGVAFDNYSGEDVVIFDEFRTKDYSLSYDTVLRLCDPFAKNVTTNVKYQKITLSNLFNVFVGPENFIKFVINETYAEETINQLIERFALVIEVEQDNFKISVLKPNLEVNDFYKDKDNRIYCRHYYDYPEWCKINDIDRIKDCYEFYKKSHPDESYFDFLERFFGSSVSTSVNDIFEKNYYKKDLLKQKEIENYKEFLSYDKEELNKKEFLDSKKIIGTIKKEMFKVINFPINLKIEINQNNFEKINDFIEKHLLPLIELNKITY